MVYYLLCGANIRIISIFTKFLVIFFQFFTYFLSFFSKTTVLLLF